MEILHEKIKNKFIENYDKYNDAIFRYCFLQTKNHTIAVEITRDTFFKAWDYIITDKETNEVHQFLYRIAGNLVINYNHENKIIPLIQNIDVKKTLDFIDQIDEKYRDVVIMHYTDNLSIKELSEITGETETNVSVRLHLGVEQNETIEKERSKAKKIVMSPDEKGMMRYYLSQYIDKTILEKATNFKKQNPSTSITSLYKKIITIHQGTPSIETTPKWKLYVKTVIITVISVFLGCGILIYMADKSLPGDFLYKIKININEPIQITFSKTIESRAILQVNFIKERIIEKTILLERNLSQEGTDALLASLIIKETGSLQKSIELLGTERKNDVILSLTAELLPEITKLLQKNKTPVLSNDLSNALTQLVNTITIDAKKSAGE
ncbi:MAG: sigma-70 family RNA polymerase sigma factor [bacterium]|nr:sigma-70 family RNA polymerase sigma factor [bacterium]